MYYMPYGVRKFFPLLSVLSRHISWPVGARLVLTLVFRSLPYFGKVTKVFQLTPNGYEMAAKIVAYRG